MVGKYSKFNFPFNINAFRFFYLKIIRIYTNFWRIVFIFV